MSDVRPGFTAFCDVHDDTNLAETIRKLTRAGAVRAYPCALGNNGRRVSLDALKAFRDACGAHDIAVRPFFFHGLRFSLRDTRAWYAEVKGALGLSGMLDAEPDDGLHWSRVLLAPVLADDPDMWITTTRAEAPNLGRHGRRVLAQFERQNSIATLDRGLDVFYRFSDVHDVAPVIGLFDEKNDPRELPEVLRDIDACTPAAKTCSELSAWNIHTMGDAEADAIRERALRIF